jgi:hypothetical protein
MNSILMHPIEGGSIMWMSSSMVGNKHMGNWTLANWRVQKWVRPNKGPWKKSPWWVPMVERMIMTSLLLKNQSSNALKIQTKYRS